MYLNIQSLPRKFKNLKVLLCEFNENKTIPHTLLLCENWLNSQNN